MAAHPDSGEPILAGIGRYGPYVQHGKTYANLGRDDDVLEIGGNRAIDLIVAKESGAAASAAGAADPGRPLGTDPQSGSTVTVKAGRFGPYVTDGTTNATLPRTLPQEAVTLEQAIALLAARREAGGGKKSGRGGRRTASAKGSSKASAGKAGAKKAATASKAASPAKPDGAKTAGKTAAKKAAAKKPGSKTAAAKKSAARKAG